MSLLCVLMHRHPRNCVPFVKMSHCGTNGSSTSTLHVPVWRVRGPYLHTLVRVTCRCLHQASHKHSEGVMPSHHHWGAVILHSLRRRVACPRQVVYPLWLGRILHHLPLLLVLVALCLESSSKPWKSSAACGAAGGAAVWVASVAAGTALPALAGALRAYTSCAPG